MGDDPTSIVAPIPAAPGFVGSGVVGPPIAVGTDLTAVHEFTIPSSSLRGRGSFQFWVWGPGNIVDFEIWVSANDGRDCPRTPYIGPDNTTQVNGALINPNILYIYPDTWPTVAPNVESGEAAMITFFHQYYGKIRLFLKADQPGTIVQVFTQG